MKVWISEHIFDHPWESVVKANWKKYPNPMNTAVVGTDVLDRKVVDGVLHTHRLVSTKWGFPKWAQSLFGNPSICYASEHSEVNPLTKEMTLKTKNLTFHRFIAVDEKLCYTPHPDDPSKTLLRQEATVAVTGVPLNNYVEDVLTSRICQNAGKGRQAIDWVIQRGDADVKDIATSAVKNSDDLLTHTKKSIDDITTTARRSMDDFSSAAKKSFDELHNLTNVQQRATQSIPEL